MNKLNDFFLQGPETFQIKVVEITPKFEWIGLNIEETVQLQKDHEFVHKKIQVIICFSF